MKGEIDRDCVCLAIHMLETYGLDTGKTLEEIRKVVASVRLPPQDVFEKYIHLLEDEGYSVVAGGEHAYNVFARLKPGEARQLITIYYNTDYKYSIDVCIADPDELRRLAETLNRFTREVTAIQKVGEVVDRAQRLLDRSSNTAYYDAIYHVVMEEIGRSAWVI